MVFGEEVRQTPGWELDVEVTREDIAAGKAHDFRRCPIARALARVVPLRSREAIFVGTTEVFLDTPWDRLGMLPASADRFIRAFDGGELCEPMDFTLPIAQGGL